MSNKVSTLLLLAFKKACNIINKYFSPEESLVDKLIAERRNEAKNECSVLGFVVWIGFNVIARKLHK
ncbi:hypothetical protein [Rickettsia honei]|uniref:hypothetical protein n=1 Tax=Rickettsia honei TaxID=37816 RepID=UPI0002F95F1E|nr:hypothetical protein [Rickettsia honei]